jgi:hypothetical protein
VRREEVTVEETAEAGTQEVGRKGTLEATAATRTTAVVRTPAAEEEETQEVGRKAQQVLP